MQCFGSGRIRDFSEQGSGSVIFSTTTCSKSLKITQKRVFLLGSGSGTFSEVGSGSGSVLKNPGSETLAYSINSQQTFLNELFDFYGYLMHFG